VEWGDASNGGARKQLKENPLTFQCSRLPIKNSVCVKSPIRDRNVYSKTEPTIELEQKLDPMIRNVPCSG
jgi:hypothetical protein